MNIISTFFEYIEQLIPVKIIHSYEQGVRWTFGKPGPILKQGIKFFFPFLQSIDTLPTTLSPAQFEVDILTIDGIECTCRIGMEYYIQNIITLYSKVQEGEIAEGLPTLSVIASGLAASVLSSYTYQALWTDKEKVEEEIADECNAVFKTKGIFVEDMRISSLKKTQGLKLFVTSSPTILTEIKE